MQPKNRLQSGKRELHPYVRPGLCSVWFSKEFLSKFCDEVQLGTDFLKIIKSSFVIILFHFIWNILQIIQKVFNFIM